MGACLSPGKAYHWGKPLTKARVPLLRGRFTKFGDPTTPYPVEEYLKTGKFRIIAGRPVNRGLGMLQISNEASPQTDESCCGIMAPFTGSWRDLVNNSQWDRLH